MIHRVHAVVGSRPNFMKAAPLFHELRRRPWCEPVLVHTGQRYDHALSQAFFEDLGMPEPCHSLNVGSASHTVMTGYEAFLSHGRPAVVIVVGGINSTAVCALAGNILDEGKPSGRRPELWAGRMAESLSQALGALPKDR